MKLLTAILLHHVKQKDGGLGKIFLTYVFIANSFDPLDLGM